MADLLAPAALRRLAMRRRQRGPAAGAVDIAEARQLVVTRWDEDLCGFLNALSRGELAELARHLGVAVADQPSPVLRAAVWQAGARLERGDAEVAPAVQPRP